jgi:hypothetical protein
VLSDPSPTGTVATLTTASWSAQFPVYQTEKGPVVLVPKLLLYANAPLLKLGDIKPKDKDPSTWYAGVTPQLGLGLPVPKAVKDKTNNKDDGTIVISGGADFWSVLPIAGEKPKLHVGPVVGLSVLKRF